MKILYFMNHVDKGGAALALLDLIIELKKHSNIEFIVITGKRNELNKSLDAMGVENYAVGFKNFMSSYKAPVYIYCPLLWLRYKLCKYYALKRIQKLVDLNSIHIIHSNLNRIDMGAIISEKFNIPHVWHVRELVGIHFRLMSMKKNPIQYMNHFASEYIVVSESVERIWTDRGLNKDTCHLIYDGVRSELYNNVTNKKNASDKVRMIFLGGYDKKKGQEEFLDALSLLEEEYRKKLQIDFYGNGTTKYIQVLNRKVERYGLKGFVNIYPYDHEVWRKIPHYDVGLNCSNAEAFGRITVEYMMSGLCPLVSDTGANTEIVQDKVTGLVYRKGDIRNLKEKIIDIIDHPTMASEYAMTAKDHAIANFSMTRHAEKIMLLYNKLINAMG